MAPRESLVRSRCSAGTPAALRAWVGACALACVLVVDAWVSPASGAHRSRPPTDASALELFEQGAQAYREGRFQEAVDKLLEARRHKAAPVLLYDLGRAYEALGRSSEAADAYTQYLVEEPDAEDRGAIEGRIATLRAQAAELASRRSEGPSPRRDPPEAADAPAPQRSPLAAAGPWIVTGVGVAGIGAGIVLGVLAGGRHDDAVAEPVQTAAVSDQEAAESLATASTITLIAGAIVAAVGLAWFGFRLAEPRATSRGFVFGGTF